MNYVADNIHTVERFSHELRQEELAERMELWREKVEVCRERKMEIELDRYKRNVFLLHKWDILREKVSLTLLLPFNSYSLIFVFRGCNMRRHGGSETSKRLDATLGLPM